MFRSLEELFKDVEKSNKQSSKLVLYHLLPLKLIIKLRLVKYIMLLHLNVQHQTV